MFDFLNPKEPEIKPTYIIGQVPQITKDERSSLVSSVDFRKIMTKWCDAEIAKNTTSLVDFTLTESQLRQSQGYVQGILHVRNFIKNLK